MKKRNKGSMKEQIEYKHGTKNIETVEQNMNKDSMKEQIESKCGTKI
jgi:hypothetical protein